MTRSKRNQQRARNTRRRDVPTGSPPPRVLIVTEGSVSETQYFRLLAAEMGLGRQQVVIESRYTSSPMQVVALARKRLDDNGPFEYVYCVFDRDTHDSYHEAVRLVLKMAKDGLAKKVEAITSIPCFEYWCYLHVANPSASYEGVPSPCDRLTKELRNYAPFENYSKGKGWMSANFGKLAANRNEAVKRSEKRLANAQKAGDEAYSEDPSTRIHIVVDDLKRLGEMDEG